MSFKEYLNLIINLIKDWRVIVTVIAVIFVINCVCKIVDYRKKPKKVKKSKLLTEKTPAPEAQAQPAEAETFKSGLSDFQSQVFLFVTTCLRRTD